MPAEDIRWENRFRRGFLAPSHTARKGLISDSRALEPSPTHLSPNSLRAEVSMPITRFASYRPGPGSQPPGSCPQPAGSSFMR